MTSKLKYGIFFIDINNMVMMNKFLILAVIAVTIVTLSANSNNITNAQEPPPLEKPTTAVPSEAAGLSLGKITIQISQTEQIIIDLPIKSDNKYQVVPIK